MTVPREKRRHKPKLASTRTARALSLPPPPLPDMPPTTRSRGAGGTVKMTKRAAEDSAGDDSGDDVEDKGSCRPSLEW